MHFVTVGNMSESGIRSRYSHAHNVVDFTRGSYARACRLVALISGNVEYDCII